ncbi:alcohol dehydrogenase catalytic domain-containing protein [Streptomyces broussonetiae]|uniref:alcohol dehydrogenase catalytic domain-containing protein n=1 Tax=Streptomyces broussonetiae TaxID=2686304 RepID=UPI0035DC794B
MTRMQAARMHGYKEPLRIEEVPVPEPGPDEILLMVAATGMCRSGYRLLDGYFEGPFPVDLPYIPGPEVTGRVAALGSAVPSAVGYSEGDMVVVNPGWGDGTCRQCREGNEQLCSGNGRWVGFGPPGGFAEYMAVECRHAIPVSGEAAKAPEHLAPMTDAGMTPYRGMRKLRDAGKPGPGRTVAVTGIGGPGSYAVQCAKLLGGGASVVAFAHGQQNRGRTTPFPRRGTGGARRGRS